MAASYYEIGRLAGRQVEKILIGGTRPGDLPIARMTDFAISVNLSMARDIGLFSPGEPPSDCGGGRMRDDKRSNQVRFLSGD